MTELNFEQAAHRLQSCYGLQDRIREELLLGENGKQAVPRINPNKVTVENIEPVVVELRRATIQMEEVVKEYGDPGDNLLWSWYWSGQDDLKRLRGRVDFYQSALDYARALPPERQREYLYENVFLPVLFGSRHKKLDDPQSPMLHAISDFCEPARIYKNYVYAINLNDAATGMGAFWHDIWGVVSEYYESMEDFADTISTGLEKIAGFAKKAAFPVGVLLLGASAYMLFRDKR